MVKTTLAQLRRTKDLSQRELARILDLTPSTIAMYEIGQRTPQLETAKKIASIFGVHVEDIFFGKDVRIMRAATGTEGV